MPFRALRGGSPKRKMPRNKKFDVMPEHALMGQMLQDHGFVKGKPNNDRGSSNFGITPYTHYGSHDQVEIYHRDHDVPASKYGSGYKIAAAGQFTFHPSTSYNGWGIRVPRKSVPNPDDPYKTSSPPPAPPPPGLVGSMGAYPLDAPEVQSWSREATAPEPMVSGRGSEALRAALHKFGHRGKFESKESDMRLLELDKKNGSNKPGATPTKPITPATKGGAGKKPENAPPELPKTLNPADVHNYYMAMASFHDSKSWMNKRLSGLKPLWSDGRTMHDDKHLFHKAMRDGFAQKALAVDLAAPMNGEPGFQGMKESIQESVSPERIQVGHDIHTLEEFLEQYGESPLQALRSGRLTRFSIVAEAFAGTAPTGALNTINNNKSDSSKPLPMKSPFPSNAPKAAAPKVPTVPKMPTMPKTTEATQRVLAGEDVFDVLNSLPRK